MTGTPLGRGRRAREGACDVELAGVIALQQRGAETPRGGVGAEYELEIETRQREARRRNERGANTVKGTTSRGQHTLP